MTGLEILELTEAIEKGERLTDTQVQILAKLRREENKGRTFMNVSKVALADGEDIYDFIWLMYDSVQTNRIVLADGSLDACLDSIYDDYVIIRDCNTGRMFKANFSRDTDGEILFDKVIEVRQAWVAVNEVEKKKSDIVEMIKNNKWSFLPTSLSRKG